MKKLITVKLTKKELSVLKEIIGEEIAKQGSNPWVCEKCGKCETCSSRQEAENAGKDVLYARKIGICICGRKGELERALKKRRVPLL